LSSWLNQPIPLELDHIDGNNQNNQLNNLRLLCPNCHAQTSNYRGKNIKNKKNICVCGRIKKPASQLCITCYNLKTYSK
jgi:5-methylcytosine-specific restriction endonuclease McrA